MVILDPQKDKRGYGNERFRELAARSSFCLGGGVPLAPWGRKLLLYS